MYGVLQKLTEAKIERIHQLEEEMQGLARRVDPLIQKEIAARKSSSMPKAKQTDLHATEDSPHVPNGLNFPK